MDLQHIPLSNLKVLPSMSAMGANRPTFPTSSRRSARAACCSHS